MSKFRATARNGRVYLDVGHVLTPIDAREYAAHLSNLADDAEKQMADRTRTKPKEKGNEVVAALAAAQTRYQNGTEKVVEVEEDDILNNVDRRDGKGGFAISAVEAELLASGAPWWLVREAAASAQMAQHDDGTYIVDGADYIGHDPEDA